MALGHAMEYWWGRLKGECVKGRVVGLEEDVYQPGCQCR